MHDVNQFSTLFGEMESPESEKEDMNGPDLDLVEEAVLYLTDKTYPENCSNSRKRQIRKKSEKFELKEGELYYNPGKGKPV